MHVAAKATLATLATIGVIGIPYSVWMGHRSAGRTMPPEEAAGFVTGLDEPRPPQATPQPTPQPAPEPQITPRSPPEPLASRGEPIPVEPMTPDPGPWDAGIQDAAPEAAPVASQVVVIVQQDPQAAIVCGPVLCAPGQACCNASCGICGPPGGTCTNKDCAVADRVDIHCRHGHAAVRTLFV